jgi:hypothetical protein
MGAFKGQVRQPAQPDHVVTWRVQRLRAAGCPAQLADAIAHDGRYDLHELLELIDRGCLAEVAARILAPVED